MTEFDRAYMQERREEHNRELRQTLDDEHRRGLNSDPYYHWTRGEIERYEASLNADAEPRETRDTDDCWHMYGVADDPYACSEGQ